MIELSQALANPKEFLGRDIKLINNDIKFSGSNDFDFAIYETNLGQAIKMKLLTTLGELTLHPNYGTRLSDLLARGYSDNIVIKIKEEIRAGLMQEPRVEKIKQLKIDKVNDVYQVDIVVKPINSKKTYNLIFDLFE